jgi:hypothetical protein
MSIPTNHGGQMVVMNAPVPWNTTLVDFKQWLCDLLQQGHIDSFNRDMLSELVLRAAELYRTMHQSPAGLPPTVDPSMLPPTGPHHQIHHDIALVQQARSHVAPPLAPRHQDRQEIAPGPRSLSHASPPSDPRHQARQEVAPVQHALSEVSFLPPVRVNKIQSSADGSYTRFDNDLGKLPLKRDHDRFDESEDENVGRTIHNKKQKTLSNMTELKRGYGARIEAKMNDGDSSKPEDTLPAMNSNSYDMNTMRSSLPAITIQSSAPPQSNATKIRASSLQAAIFDGFEHDGRSLFIAQPKLSNRSVPLCTARDIIDGLRVLQRTHPSGAHHPRLPTPTEVQHNLFGFKVTWPTPIDVLHIRDFPIQLHGLSYNFQTSSSHRSNGIVTKARKGTQAAVIAALVRGFGDNQVALAEMHYRGVFTGKYWVRMLQPPQLSKNGKELKLCGRSKSTKPGISTFVPARSDVCNVCEKPLSEPCNNCFIIPVKHPKLCSSFL